MSDSVRPHRWQPTRLPRPWDSPGKNTGVGCHFLLECVKVKVKSLSRVRPSATPWTASHQAPPSVGFSRQEYWSRVPLLSPMYRMVNVKGWAASCLLLLVSFGMRSSGAVVTEWHSQGFLSLRGVSSCYLQGSIHVSNKTWLVKKKPEKEEVINNSRKKCDNSMGG